MVNEIQENTNLLERSSIPLNELDYLSEAPNFLRNDSKSIMENLNLTEEYINHYPGMRRTVVRLTMTNLAL